MTEYAILGWLIQRARSGRTRRAWVAVVADGGALCGDRRVSPVLHAGPHAAVTDVMIDSVGAAIGVGLAIWRS